MSERRAGGSVFSQELTRIRNAARAIHAALEKATQSNGAQIVAVIAMQNAVIFDALNELDRIGRDAKAERVNHKDGG